MTHDEALESPLGKYLLRYCYCGPSALPSVDAEGRAGTAPTSDTCRIHYALSGIDPILKEMNLQVNENAADVMRLQGELSESRRLNGEYRKVLEKISGHTAHREDCPNPGFDPCECLEDLAKEVLTENRIQETPRGEPRYWNCCGKLVVPGDSAHPYGCQEKRTCGHEMPSGMMGVGATCSNPRPCPVHG